MKSRIIRRRYQSGTNQNKKYFRKILQLYKKFKKKYSTTRRHFNILKKKFHKNKDKNKLTKEKLDKDLENYLKDNKENKENKDVEMKSEQNPKKSE